MYKRLIAGLLAAPILFAQTTATISGKITDAATQQPVAGAQVSFGGGPGQISTSTNADGAYSFEVPAREFGGEPVNGTIRVSKTGYAPLDLASTRETMLRPRPGIAETHDYQLLRAASIVGHLLDRDTGKPVPDCWVQAFRQVDLARFHYPAAPSSSDGTFSISNLPPGEYTLEIDPPMSGRIQFGDLQKNEPGYAPTWYPGVARADMASPLTLSPGENRPIEVRIQKRVLHRIDGEFQVPEGMDLEGINITVTASGSQFTVEGSIPRPGPFHIDGLPQGSYRILASTKAAPGGVRAYANKEVDLNGGHDPEALTIALRPGVTLICVVTMSEEEAGLPEHISFLPISVEGWGPLEPPPPGSRATISNQRKIVNLPSGEYRVYPNNLPGYAIASTLYNGQPTNYLPVDLEAPESTITFVLTSRPGRVSGIVRDADQNPVANAQVVLLPDSLPANLEKVDLQVERIATSDSNGAYRIADLAPGRYRVKALAGLDHLQMRDLTYIGPKVANGQVVTVEAAQTATVELRIGN